MGYMRGIRGIFTAYTYVSGMYRVCIGYVSGMYRESVEAYKVRMGGFDKLVERNRSSNKDKTPTRKSARKNRSTKGR